MQERIDPSIDGHNAAMNRVLNGFGVDDIEFIPSNSATIRNIELIMSV
jgi:hypothetical protein